MKKNKLFKYLFGSLAGVVLAGAVIGGVVSCSNGNSTTSQTQTQSTNTTSSSTTTANNTTSAPQTTSDYKLSITQDKTSHNANVGEISMVSTPSLEVYAGGSTKPDILSPNVTTNLNLTLKSSSALYSDWDNGEGILNLAKLQKSIGSLITFTNSTKSPMLLTYNSPTPTSLTPITNTLPSLSLYFTPLQTYQYGFTANNNLFVALTTTVNKPTSKDYMGFTSTTAISNYNLITDLKESDYKFTSDINFTINGVLYPIKLNVSLQPYVTNVDTNFANNQPYLTYQDSYTILQGDNTFLNMIEPTFTLFGGPNYVYISVHSSQLTWDAWVQLNHPYTRTFQFPVQAMTTNSQDYQLTDTSVLIASQTGICITPLQLQIPYQSK